VFIAEVHVVLFLSDFVDLAEFVHVELSHKGGEVVVSEEAREYFVLESFAVFY
jgi:hypothetical protein